MRKRLATVSVKSEDETKVDEKKNVIAKIDLMMEKLATFKNKIAEADGEKQIQEVVKEVENLPINKEVEKQVAESDKETSDIVKETFEQASGVTVDDGDNFMNRMGSISNAKKIKAAKRLVQIANEMIQSIK